MPRAIPSQKRAHFCVVCQKAFTTSGHLLRHSKVHTGEKKHKCPFPGCQTSCSRQDNLQQHYRIHLSPGSRRSASTFVLKSSPAPSDSNRRSSTPPALSTPPTNFRSLPEDVPYTVVDGPPVLRVPPRDTSISSPFLLPSPPNTPPPLVPASPHLVLLRQQVLGRRNSTGTMDYARLWNRDESHHPLRPLSSSSCSSSSSSSLSFDPSNRMVVLDGTESTSSIAEIDAASHSVWLTDDGGSPHRGMVATPEEYMSTPMTYMSELTKSSSYFQPMYDSNRTPDYFGYATPQTPSLHLQPALNSSPPQLPSDNLDFFNQLPAPTVSDFTTTFNSEGNPKLEPLTNDLLYDSYPSYTHPPSSSYPYDNPHSSVAPAHSQPAINNSGFVTHASTTNPQILHSQLGTSLGIGWDIW